MNVFKNIVPLVFIFLCLKAKAEFAHSALAVKSIFQKDSTLVNKYEMAKILFEEEKMPKAFKLALPLTEIDSDLELKIKATLLVGKILLESNENLKAVEYLKKSLVLLSKNVVENDTNVFSNMEKADNFLQLSIAYKRISEKDSSKYYLNKLININSVNSGVQKLKARAYKNLGTFNVRENNLQEAEKNIRKAINIYTELKDNIALSSSYINLANIFVEKEQYEEGRKLYDKALVYIQNEKSLKAVRNKELLLDNIAWALYNLKDYRAYEYVVDSQELRDSLDERDLQKAIEQIKAENDVKVVQAAAEEEQLKQEQKTWAVGAAGAAVSMLLLYLANLYKLRQRSLSLELSQNELRQQRKLERLNSQTQVKILNATLDGKETERKQIAEILHDNVSALLSSANMHLEATQKQYGDNTPEELQKTRQIITEASEKIRDLSHNLVSSVLLKFGLEYAIKDLAKKFSNSEIKISTAILNVYRYSQDFEIKMFNIVQELVNNILKHSNAKNAYIMLEEEEENINLIVKDDGVGFEQRTEEESGIGLNQIKARINMMNGNFFIESATGSGTKVIASVPVIRDETVVSA